MNIIKTLFVGLAVVSACLAQSTAISAVQAEPYGVLITKCNKAIKNIDSIVEIYQQQKMLLVEQRARLNLLKDARTPNPDINRITKGPIEIAAAGLYIGIEAINAAEALAKKAIEEETARTEQKLKEQREWKEAHPGKAP